MFNQLVLASIATLGTCAGLPAGDMKDPHYWGDYFVDKYAADRAASLQLSETPPPRLTQTRTVLLITGVTIPATSFDPIVARLQRDGFKTVMYEPPALLSGDLFENADALAAVVDRVVAESGETKIDILAECTGGLIARHYIQALGGDAHVHRLVTFISPQHGLPKAPLAASFVGWPALDDLTPGSTFLETVNNAPLPATVDVTSVYSCTDEYIQPYETSIIPGAINIGVGCDGQFVGHFDFFYNSDLYVVMHGALTKPLTHPDPTDPAAPANPTDPAAPIVDAADTGGCSSHRGTTSGAIWVLGAMTLVGRRRLRTWK
ncbi:MAG: hypothetical protein KBG15_18970 [Kofleriaceae bacterium]|nr:hypothetical protein [Kofleriaceae bacterium]